MPHLFPNTRDGVIRLNNLTNVDIMDHGNLAVVCLVKSINNNGVNTNYREQEKLFPAIWSSSFLTVTEQFSCNSNVLLRSICSLRSASLHGSKNISKAANYSYYTRIGSRILEQITSS